jgi:hypothetical protein
MQLLAIVAGIVVVGMLVLGVPTAFAQGASDASTLYRLNPKSNFQRGCFAPCMCPMFQSTGVRGTFVLTSTGFDGLFYTYTVTDVNWVVASGDQELRVTGSGTYKVGGEFTVQQELALDLKIGDDPVQHFDSGMVPAGEKLPDISVTISMHGQVCFDTVFFVDASPVPADQIHPYTLVPESTFQQGCFPPCDCPLGMPRPLSGTFALIDLRQGPLFNEFAVVNVYWLVAGAPDGTGIPVRGFGTYRVGGEFAVQQQLSLDLWVGDEGPTHFDSGLVAGGGEFPRIDVSTSVNGQYCFDTVIDLHARPSDRELGTDLFPPDHVDKLADHQMQLKNKSVPNSYPITGIVERPPTNLFASRSSPAISPGTRRSEPPRLSAWCPSAPSPPRQSQRFPP